MPHLLLRFLKTLFASGVMQMYDPQSNRQLRLLFGTTRIALASHNVRIARV